MAVSKPEMDISQLVDEIEENFQRLSDIFVNDNNNENDNEWS